MGPFMSRPAREMTLSSGMQFAGSIRHGIGSRQLRFADGSTDGTTDLQLPASREGTPRRDVSRH